MIALAQVESAGIRVDAAYLDTALDSTAKSIKEMELELQNDKEVYPVWKRGFGAKLNLGSRPQLAKVVFDLMKQTSKGVTKTGRKRTDKEALELVELPFVRTFVRLEEYKKARSTYLVGLKKELAERDGYWFVHPFFNLNTVISYRSSSNAPNFQNQPARNPEIAEMIRKCYIPRKGRHFVEVDYAQIEVRVPAALTGDQELKRYVLDKSTDMHRDQACAVFKIPPEEVNRKTARSTAKNNFVFASFYGAAGANCARKIWEDIDRFNIQTMSGVPMKKHLARKGIKELGDFDLKAIPKPGTFVHHVKQCQDALWQRFKGYADWRQKQYEKYLRQGFLRMVTGFLFDGIGPKNEVTNYLIQGPAFHCTLWSLIEINKQIRKYKMKTKVIGEIHDSLQGDSPPKELNDFNDICVEVMTEKLPKVWSWLSVPLEVEVEVAPLNKSWFYKKEWCRDSDGWALKV